MNVIGLICFYCRVAWNEVEQLPISVYRDMREQAMNIMFGGSGNYEYQFESYADKRATLRAKIAAIDAKKQEALNG